MLNSINTDSVKVILLHNPLDPSAQFLSNLWILSIQIWQTRLGRSNSAILHFCLIVIILNQTKVVILRRAIKRINLIETNPATNMISHNIQHDPDIAFMTLLHQSLQVFRRTKMAIQRVEILGVITMISSSSIYTYRQVKILYQ